MKPRRCIDSQDLTRKLSNIGFLRAKRQALMQTRDAHGGRLRYDWAMTNNGMIQGAAQSLEFEMLRLASIACLPPEDHQNATFKSRVQQRCGEERDTQNAEQLGTNLTRT
jgi:hypothetical protein